MFFFLPGNQHSDLKKTMETILGFHHFVFVVILLFLGNTQGQTETKVQQSETTIITKQNETTVTTQQQNETATTHQRETTMTRQNSMITQQYETTTQQNETITQQNKTIESNFSPENCSTNDVTLCLPKCCFENQVFDVQTESCKEAKTSFLLERPQVFTIRYDIITLLIVFA
jgi:hypothetical protein